MEEKLPSSNNMISTENSNMISNEKVDDQIQRFQNEIRDDKKWAFIEILSSSFLVYHVLSLGFVASDFQRAQMLNYLTMAPLLFNIMGWLLYASLILTDFKPVKYKNVFSEYDANKAYRRVVRRYKGFIELWIGIQFVVIAFLIIFINM